MKLFSHVDEAPLPEGALLQEFVDRGEYTDCFVANVAVDVTFSEYVEAFYTTRLFKLERHILRWLASRPSTDEEARQIARNEIPEFAAWTEYRRSDNQLVMMDFRQQTCSWFMLAPQDSGSLLYFGSAVMRNRETKQGKDLKWTYRSLLGFHRLYSRALLQAAVRRIGK
ncbi:MAG: hypothetical protein QNI99_11370 [Woeseiaceae bacterium]|nr:hypothetical protein [Woeseiaceae bacterium]